MSEPTIKANFKSTTATTLEVTDTATVANLQVQQFNGTGYSPIKFDPAKELEKPAQYDATYIPTIQQVVKYIQAQSRAELQIVDLSGNTTDINGEGIRNNMTLSDSVTTSGIYFKPHLNNTQTGYYTTDDVATYNANKKAPGNDNPSNFKKYWLTDVTIGSGKTLTVYNQGTMNLAYNGTSTSWIVTVSSDGKTITFQ